MRLVLEPFLLISQKLSTSQKMHQAQTYLHVRAPWLSTFISSGITRWGALLQNNPSAGHNAGLLKV